MSGKELERRIKETGMTKTDIAEKVGISVQNLVNKLNAEDVKTGFIEELARVTGRDLGWWYGYGSTISGSIIGSGDGNSVHTDAQQYLSLLAKKDEQMDRLIAVIESLTAAKNG